MFYSYRALIWAGNVWISCTIVSATVLHSKYLCSRHFLECDFSTAERVYFNIVSVLCGSDSASQSVPQPLVPSLHTPSLDPLPSVIAHKDYIHVIPPTRTYSKTLVPSTVSHIPIHAGSLFTSFQCP
jgi:hypothetical protein